MSARVKSWMTPDPLTVRDDAAALEALDLMVDHGIRHLPVLDRAAELVGILSFDDLRAALPGVSLKQPPAAAERPQLLELAVAEAMTWAPRTVGPDTPLEHAARTLAEERIGCLPVLDAEGRLVGILSEVDALRALVAVLHGRPPATARGEMEGLVAALRDERQRLAERLAGWRQAERALAAESGGEPGDPADRAGDARDRAGLVSLCERAARRLDAIDAALERAAQGRFGVCARCHGAIAGPRLRTLPETSLCARCARADTHAGGSSA